MGSTQIIFSYSVTGHYLEYLHHLYMGYLGKKQGHIIFVIPESFREQKKLLHWPEVDHISFDLMSGSDVGKLDDIWYKKQLRLSLLIRRYTNKHQANKVFVIELLSMLPALPFVLKRKTKVSGIIYSIYLYRWKQLKIHRKLSEIIWHTLLAKCNLFDQLYILNDHSAAKYLNKLYTTKKFTYLPDPFIPMSYPYKDLRAGYSIPVSKKILFHFGSMGEKKGTLLILESIQKMSQVERDKFVFVIAGIVQNGIKERFYNSLKKIGDSSTILVFDYFNSFETIANWCQNCDAILIPYLSSYNSSGILGYAAYYKKPVIATSQGLVGKLVRKYHLGITLKSVDEYNLIKAYGQIDEWKSVDSNYMISNTVDEFFKIIDQE